MIGLPVGENANWGKVYMVGCEGHQYRIRIVDVLLPLLNPCSERDGLEFQMRKMGTRLCLPFECLARWSTSKIPTLERQRHRDWKFSEFFLIYMPHPVLNKEKKIATPRWK